MHSYSTIYFLFLIVYNVSLLVYTYRMSRNDEFIAGHGVRISAFHVTPKSNRASIEKKGLIPGTPYVDSGKRKPNAGVFGVLKPKHVEGQAFAADDRAPTIENGTYKSPEGPHAGGDVWKFTVPTKKVAVDTWTSPRRSSIKHDGTISPRQLERVGHITGTGEVHWHREEDCK